MAYGDTPYDEQLKRAWEDFCDKIKSAGSLIFRDTEAARPTPLDRATGISISVAIHFQSAQRTL